jgi:polar amino acid transport system permease protein
LQAPTNLSSWSKRRATDSYFSDLILFFIGTGLLIWLVYLGATSMGYNWQWYRVPRYLYRVIDGELILGPLIKGLLVTLQITFWSALLALAVGLLTALLRLSRSVAGHGLATVYLELVRNTPLLVQMFLFYFVLSPIFDIERFWTGVICLAFFEAAFISEIIRGGILSVSRGQWEAASALGLNARDTYARVVMPQALPLMLPPLTNAVVNLIKNSAIVSTIAIFDLTTEGRNVIADTFMSFEIWFTVAAIYLLLTISLSSVVGLLERRAAKAGAR